MLVFQALFIRVLYFVNTKGGSMLGIIAASLYIMHSLVYHVSLGIHNAPYISVHNALTSIPRQSLVFIMHPIYCHVTCTRANVSEREARNKRCPNCCDLPQKIKQSSTLKEVSY